MMSPNERLRVALLAGTLAQGGAEKQLVYMTRALRAAGAEVRVYSLTRGEIHEPILRALGCEPIWIGRYTNPLIRLMVLNMALRQYRPHVLQAAHFYTNLYTTISGHLWNIMTIGAIRNDARQDINLNGRWGHTLLRMPSVIVANSYAARRNAETMGVRSDAVRVVPNVIDLAAFDNLVVQGARAPSQVHSPMAVAVAKFKAQKRLDRFLGALALARREVPDLKGMLIGDGAEQSRLEALAHDLGLFPDGLLFLGRRNDVPALLSHASMLVLSSDHEGFPNVILEAMAARLPVITTPAGDSGLVVQDGITGYVVPFDDIESMAERMIQLARSSNLRRELGVAGRNRVEKLYSFDGLADQLLSTYRSIAERRHDARLLSVLTTDSSGGRLC
jgi:glycosyltransferase involved in cell wall biosynthesis